MILLVEDDPLTARVESRQLEGRGYSVEHATSGEAALEMVSEQPGVFSLILMDIDLGEGMDGTETARAILRNVDIPVVFLSAHTEPEVVQKTEEIGSYGYVVKESGITVLDASIKMAYRLFESRRLELAREGELEESEARWKSIAENPFDWLVIIDREGIIQYANRSAPDSRPRQELVGKASFYEFISLEHRDAVRALLGPLFATGEAVHFQVQNRDRTLWSSNHAGAIRSGDDEIRLASIVSRDITREKQSELQLKEIQRMWRDAERMARQGSWKFDPSNGASVWTEEVYRITGRAIADGPPRFSEWLAQVQKDDRLQMATSYRRSLESGQPSSIEYRFRRFDDQRLIHLRTIAEIERDQNGTISRVYGCVQDIDQAKQVEIERQRLFDELELAVSTARLGIWRLNLDSGRLSWNDRMLSIYGVTREEFEENLEAWRAMLHPDDASHANERLAAIHEGQQVFDVEFRIIRKDGEVRNISASGVPVYDDQNRISEVLGINVDVTETVQSQIYAREIFEYSPNAIVIHDDAGRCIAANPAAARLLGVANAVGIDLNNIEAFEPHENLASGLDASFRTSGEIRFRDMTGNDRSADFHALRMKDNMNLRILSDTTERRHAQQYIAASEARFRAAIAGSLDAFYVLECKRADDGSIVDFTIAEINERAAAQLSMRREELIGHGICELFPVNRENGYFEQYKSVFETRAPLEQEFEIPEGYAAPGWYFQQVVPMPDGVAIFNRDITRQKRDALRLERLANEKERLLNELQHRAKNSFAMISGMMDLTAMAEGDFRSELEDLASRVRAISELYDLLHTRQGGQSVDLQTYMERITEATLMRAPGIQVHANYIECEVPVKSAIALGMILTELLTNSIKHAFGPGDRGTIRTSLAYADELGRLEVEDNGTWKERPRLPTESFGLKLVQDLAKQIGGRVEFDHQLGTRCTVHFPLPVMQEASPGG